MINIFDKLFPSYGGKVITDSKYIKDAVKNKNLEDVVKDIDNELARQQGEISALHSGNYVTVTAEGGDTSVEDIMTREGITPAVDTIYRIGAWDGTQYDDTAYSEYSWNQDDGYKFIAAHKEKGIDTDPTAGSHNLVESGGVQNELALGAVYDVSAKNPTSGPNNDGKWESLSALLSDANLNTLIPTSVRKGGMSVKFVCSSDNKYVQARCIAQNFTTDVTQWQTVDAEPTAGSDNLVKSGGVYGNTATFKNEDNTDLDIIDEQDFVLARFANGHIKTKNFDSSSGSLMTQEQVAKFNGIEEGAQVNDVVTSDNSDTDLSVSDENNNVVLKVSGGHIKTKYFDSSKLKALKPFARRTPFKVKVNTKNFINSNFQSVDINNIDTPAYYEDNCVLYLPESYDGNGKPCKLIIYCKQGASMIETDTDPILDMSGHGKIFRYMLHLGYAILGADGMPNGWVAEKGLTERAVGNYVAVESTIRAYKYVCENYNIDKNGCYIFGMSQGGHTAQNIIDNSNIPIIVAAEVAPVCSMRWHQWDLASSATVGGVEYTRCGRLNIARIFDYPTISTNEQLLALEYDPSKTIGYDPWLRNVENPYGDFAPYYNLWKLPNGVSIDDITMVKHIKCPLKVWCADNDSMLGADVMKVFVKAIKNSGQLADIQCYSTGDHDPYNHQTAIGTFVENGETIDLYPLTKDIGDWFYLFGGY